MSISRGLLAGLLALAGCGGGGAAGGASGDTPHGGTSGGDTHAAVADAGVGDTAATPAGQGDAAATPNDADLARARGLFLEGQAAYEAGHLDEAKEKLAAAYVLLPSPELAYNVARVYERMGDVENGVRLYRVYLDSGHATPAERTDIEHRITALGQYQQRQHDAIFATPPSTDELTAEAGTFFERGVALFNRHRYDAALEAFTAAYHFAPLPEIVYNLATTSERLHHTQDAIDYYREYLRARPEGPEHLEIQAKITTLRAAQNH